MVSMNRPSVYAELAIHGPWPVGRGAATRASLLLAGIAASLAACSSSAPLPPPSCPQAQIAAPADRIGNNNAAGELRYVATLARIESDCRWAEDEGIELNLAVAFEAERAAAFDGAPIELAYFVATVDPGQQIIGKQVFVASFALPEGQPSGGVVEQLTLRLPVPGEIGNAGGYRVYVGFQPGG
jgi:hypothetical protein